MDALLVRTHFVDAAIRECLDHYQAPGFGLVGLVVDESNGPMETGATPKVSLTKGAIDDLGLYMEGDTFWRCGDYGLYVARRKWPEIDNFWLVEWDVRIRFDHVADFFSLCNSNGAGGADLLCPWFGPAGHDWYWRAAMAPFRDQIYRCFVFSIVRLSARSIDHLLPIRQRMSQIETAKKFWPNDEVFVATELMAGGFSWQDPFSRHGLVTKDSFGCDRPHSERRLLGTPNDSKVYHPVRRGDAYFAKALQFAKRCPGDAALLSEDLLLECGQQRLKEFRATLSVQA